MVCEAWSDLWIWQKSVSMELIFSSEPPSYKRGSDLNWLAQPGIAEISLNSPSLLKCAIWNFTPNQFITIENPDSGIYRYKRLFYKCDAQEDRIFRGNDASETHVVKPFHKKHLISLFRLKFLALRSRNLASFRICWHLCVIRLKV